MTAPVNIMKWVHRQKQTSSKYLQFWSEDHVEFKVSDLSGLKTALLTSILPKAQRDQPPGERGGCVEGEGSFNKREEGGVFVEAVG